MFSRALRRDVIALLCLKAAALVILYQIFFAAAQPEPDGRAVRTHFLASNNSKEP
jgi:hypothetical protein